MQLSYYTDMVGYKRKIERHIADKFEAGMASITIILKTTAIAISCGFTCVFRTRHSKLQFRV